MANRNTRRLRKAQAQAFTAERKAGRTIKSPPSKRRRKWQGVLNSRPRVMA